MYNFAIFISDLTLIKKLGNIIFNNFKEMNLVGIVSNHKDLEALCKKYTINLLILPEAKYNSTHIKSIITNIESKIIICNSNTDKYKDTPNLLFLSLHESESTILSKLCEFNDIIWWQFIRNKVLKILKNLKFDFNHLGSSYYLEAITYSYFAKDDYKFENLEKYIYPYVSQKYHVNVNNIKWAITRSINKVKKRLTPEDFKKNNMNYPDKITSKNLLTEIINLL